MMSLRGWDLDVVYSIYLLYGVVVRRYWLLVDCWEECVTQRIGGLQGVIVFSSVF